MNFQTEGLRRALKFTSISEGGYVDDPKDPGGETLFGVARRKNPQWSGWERVDDYAKKLGRGTPEFIDTVETDPVLKSKSENLFVSRYWISVHAEKFPDDLGIFLFDSAIHHGPFNAMKLLQKAVNKTHKKNLIPVDGYFGPLTYKEVMELTENKYKEFLKNCLIARWEFMKAIYNSNPDRWSRFINGFRNRIYRLSREILGYKLEVGGW